MSASIPVLWWSIFERCFCSMAPWEPHVNETVLLLGVDGGGTRCRARLATPAGEVLGEGTGGPANVRFGLDESFAAIFDAAAQCLWAADLTPSALRRAVACLALAGASEPTHLAAARARSHPFRAAIVTSDAHAACVGAHGEEEGGVIIVGTGTIAWANLKGRQHRFAGWGFPVSDEGSGAWLGCEAVRRVLWAHDGRIGWTPLLAEFFADFGSDLQALVRFAVEARPRDFAELAPAVVAHAGRGDPIGRELMQLAAEHIDALGRRLAGCGAPRLCLVGGLAEHILPWLADETRQRLTAPRGDALSGALALARAEAMRLVAWAEL
jgi:glucosamine kinase